MIDLCFVDDWIESNACQVNEGVRYKIHLVSSIHDGSHLRALQ